jgi:hypothetical protein
MTVQVREHDKVMEPYRVVGGEPPGGLDAVKYR